MYMRMLVLLLISLYTSRVIFNALGIENYGIYNLVAGIIVFFSFINDGLTGATKRYITAELVKGDIISQKKIFTLSLKAHGVISLLILVGGETIGLWLINYILNIPPNRLLAANIVYQFSIISAILGVMNSPFSATIISNEKMSIYAFFSISDVVSKLAIIFFLKVLDGDKLIIYAFLLLLETTFVFLIYIIYCYRKIPMCRLVHTSDNKTLKQMFSYMGWTVWGSGSYMLTNQGISLLTNLFYNVALNAALGVSNTIVNVVTGFVKNFQIAFSPQITKYYVSKEADNLNTLTVRSSRYSSYLVLIFLLPVCFEISDFMQIWLGKYPNYADIFCIWTLICIFIESCSAPLATLITSDTNVRRYQILISLCYLLNVLLCLLFLTINLSPTFIIISRLISDIFIVSVRLSIAKNKFYEFNKVVWIKEVIFGSILVLAIPVIIGFILANLNLTSLFIRLFVVCGGVFVSTLFCIYLFGFNAREKELCIAKIKSYV